MNCEDCLAQLDEFLDEKLCSSERAAVTAHLEKCCPCHAFYTDLVVILENCEHVQAHTEEPPNAQALWLRISNTIECERQMSRRAEAKAAVVQSENAGWWTRTMETSWRLSLQQMMTAVLGVAVITALLTVVALQNVFQTANQTTAQSTLAPVWNDPKNQSTARSIEVESRLQQQQQAIDYWNRRVASRKTQWNPRLRAAFDRNLAAIDSVVADYQEQLQHNPDDSISEEMLDSALNDKMELLREFSEL